MLRQLFLCLFILPLRLSGEPLADLQLNFQTHCDFAAADCDLQLMKLDATYLAALQTQLDKAKASGKFDTVIPFRDEVLAAKAAKNPLPELPKGAPPDLVQMRAKHVEARSKILKSHAEAVATLTHQMEGALKLREAELTRAGKTDEALAVHQARKSMATDKTIPAATNKLSPAIVNANGNGWRSLLLEQTKVVNKGHEYVGQLSQARENLQKPYLNQGIWFELSLDGGGVKDELDGLGRFALVDLEPSR